jgi:branched-chain amino acid transport system substrate-binding protein
MERRTALKLMAALGATGLASACSAHSAVGSEESEVLSDKALRIGLLAPQSGGYKPIGDEIVKGFELFLDQNNRRLGGHPIDLLLADEGESPESGQAALNALLERDVTALTGVVNSSVILGIRDVVEGARIPLVGSNASPVSLQSVVYIWRTSYVDDEPSRALAPYVAQRVRKDGRVGIIAPDHQSGLDAVEGFRQAFGASDSRIADEVIWTEFTTDPSGDTYASAIDRLIERDPDAVFCAFAGVAATQFLKQLHASGYRKQVYGPGFLTEGEALAGLKDAEANGIVTALNYSTDLNNAANRRFATTYRKTHGTSPTTYAMASYDAAQVLDKAIRIAGENPDPQRVNLALGQVGQIDSPRGPWQFNQPRTPQQKWYLRRVQRDGQILSNVLLNELATLG